MATDHDTTLHAAVSAGRSSSDVDVDGSAPGMSYIPYPADSVWEWRIPHVQGAGNTAVYGVQADRLSFTIDGHSYHVTRGSGPKFWDINRLAEDMETALSGSMHEAARIKVAPDGHSLRFMNMGNVRIGKVMAHRDDIGSTAELRFNPGEFRLMLGDNPPPEGPDRALPPVQHVPASFPGPDSGAVSMMTFRLPPLSDGLSPKGMQFKIGGHDVNITFTGEQDVLGLFAKARFEVAADDNGVITIKTTTKAPMGGGEVTLSRPAVALQIRDGESGGLALDPVPSSITLSELWPSGIWNGSVREPLDLNIILRKGEILRESVHIAVDCHESTGPDQLVEILNQAFVNDPHELVASLDSQNRLVISSPEGFIFERVALVIPDGRGHAGTIGAQTEPGKPGIVPPQDTSYHHLNEPALQATLRLDRQYHEGDAAHEDPELSLDAQSLLGVSRILPQDGAMAYAQPSFAKFDLSGNTMAMAGSGNSTSATRPDLLIVNLQFQIGDEAVTVRDTFTTLKEIQQAVNDAIRTKPGLENTLAKISDGALVIENAAAQPFTAAHWSVTPAIVWLPDVLDRVDGRMASDAVPSTAFLDIGAYSGHALSLPFEFIHPVLSSPGVLHIQAQSWRTPTELANVITQAGSAHGITASFLVENNIGKIILQDQHGRDFRAERMTVSVEMPDEKHPGFAGVCLPSSHGYTPGPITSDTSGDWINLDTMACRTEEVPTLDVSPEKSEPLPTIGYSLATSEYVQDVFELLPDNMKATVAFFMPEFMELL
ncbi:hypothetical protein HEQ63_00180 [Haematospirillum jordaniae]|uniref:hypothetical protein n=1 Tax=Haematospirillum jordaniae TaxID=1549855 RepID=UPI00143290B7|nr:hypothetical protein [Haematospirillum jordaniae]NKD84610.1 hypothetical protein [Haematospirillum jordaniae]